MYQYLHPSVAEAIQQPATFIFYTVGILVLTALTGDVLYNLYFHPLAAFPGPWLGRATLLWRVKHSLGGRFHRSIQRQHQIYGLVVRVAPNELSFASGAAYKDVYGPWPARQPFLKSDFYGIFGAGFESGCIGSERNPSEHLRMKKALNPAFSNSALLRQEGLIHAHINAFIACIASSQIPSTELDMTEWFEMLAFDILGEMAFGESFDCVKDGKAHFWQKTIADHLFWINLIDNLRKFWLVNMLARIVLPFLKLSANIHSEYSREKVDRRLQSDSNKRDFLSSVTEQVRRGELSKEELTAHASTLVVAGGETVATFLAATCWYLSRDHKVQQRLSDELHQTFTSYQDIDARTAMELPYLQACISEGLRIYSPSALGLPRVSSGAEVCNRWIPKGAECYVSNYTLTHDPHIFPEPDLFQPERWLGEVSEHMRESSQPFSCGPRGCIGKNFARMEMALILSKLIYTYEMSIHSGPVAWEESSRLHIQWWKPKLFIRFQRR